MNNILQLRKPVPYVLESVWFVLKGEHRYGPFPYMEVVRLLSSKALNSRDYLWRPENSNWMRVTDLPEFAPETLHAMRMTPEFKKAGIQSRREFPRFSYGTAVIAHNMQQLFRGRSLEMSLGGAGLLIDRSDLQIGADLMLHFKPGMDLPAFNASGSVTSRLVLETPGLPLQFKYGVKFAKLDPQTLTQLNSYFGRKVAA